MSEWLFGWSAEELEVQYSLMTKEDGNNGQQIRTGLLPAS